VDFRWQRAAPHASRGTFGQARRPAWLRAGRLASAGTSPPGVAHGRASKVVATRRCAGRTRRPGRTAPTAPSRNRLSGMERRSIWLVVADDHLWGSAPHSSSSPIRPRPLIVCLRQTSGTAAPGHFRSLPLGLQKGAAAGRVGPGRPQRRRRATPMTTQSIATPRQHCAIAQVRPSVLRSRRLAALPRRGRA
jgi:hypothetical protein